MKRASLLIFFLISISIKAQQLVSGSVKVTEPISLAEYVFTNYNGETKKECLLNFLYVNPDLVQDEVLKPETVLYIPQTKSCSLKLPENSFDELVGSISKEVPLEEKTLFKFFVGNDISTINGTNKENDTELVLNSKRNNYVSISTSFKNEDVELIPSVKLRVIEFENNLSTQVKNPSHTLSELNLDFKYRVAEKFKLSFFQSYAESILHEDSSGDISLFKIQKWTGLVGAEYLFIEGDTVSSFVASAVGYSFVRDNGVSNPSGGLNYTFSIGFEKRLSLASTVQIHLYNQVQNENANNYKQELIYTGLKVGYVTDF